LTAFLLRREYDLSSGSTARQALEALVCRLVGHPGETSLDGLSRAVLSRELGSEERLTRKEIEKQFPRKLTGSQTDRLDDLGQSVVARWLRESARDGENGAPPPDEFPATVGEAAFDLVAFAATVKWVARDCPPAARF
jgi:hypothetical protein